jgi:hypothetical protein
MKKTILMVAFMILRSLTCEAQSGMTMHYSSYTSKSMNSQGRITTTVVVQGSTTVNYSLCPGCYSAVHTPKVLNQIKRVDNGAVIAGGWATGPGVTPPSGQINYTFNVTFDPSDPNSGPGPWEFLSTGQVLCSVIGTAVTIPFPSVQVEIAATWLKMRPTQVPPGGTCEVHLGIEVCQYDTIWWCTSATTPPDYGPVGVQNVFRATYPTYWIAYALCERPDPPHGVAWACTPGFTGNGLSAPDNYPLQQCTKAP